MTVVYIGARAQKDLDMRQSLLWGRSNDSSAELNYHFKQCLKCDFRNVILAGLFQQCSVSKAKTFEQFSEKRFKFRVFQPQES